MIFRIQTDAAWTLTVCLGSRVWKDTPCLMPIGNEENSIFFDERSVTHTEAAGRAAQKKLRVRTRVRMRVCAGPIHCEPSKRRGCIEPRTGTLDSSFPSLLAPAIACFRSGVFSGRSEESGSPWLGKLSAIRIWTHHARGEKLRGRTPLQGKQVIFVCFFLSPSTGVYQCGRQSTVPPRPAPCLA